MTVKRIFEKLRAAFEAAEIPYFITGSFASSAHGVPRSTNDIDVVIAPTRQQIEDLLLHFPPEEYAADLEAARQAFAHRSLFNIIDYATLWKVDLIVPEMTPFDTSRFARRGLVELAGVSLYTASPEDILITKLWWAKLGESERQIIDAAGIIQVQAEQLDTEYVRRWVTALELEQQWKLALQRTG